MSEEWRKIDDFPNYEVSSYGRVRNTFNQAFLTSRPNQWGSMMLGLSGNGGQAMRSVNVLVLYAFGEPPLQTNFNTPIHLDGDRTNCRIENLMWRPLWFAREYHAQFEKYSYDKWKVKIRLIGPGEIFTNPREAAMKYGLLEKEIRLDLTNRRGVYPGGYLFEQIVEKV
jgi:hypothetical protein